MTTIHVLEEVDSTNDLALAAAEAGAAHGACWIADHQRAGRGRREVGGKQRAWHSPAGSNLYLSLLLRPNLEPSIAAPLTLAAALGARRALVQTSDALEEDLWIKWPNDLYHGDRKLAGILTEGVMTGAKLDAVVVGIGVNVNIAASDFPQEIAEIATSTMAATDQHIDRLKLALAMRREILAASQILIEDGLEAILDELRAHDRSEGRAVLAARGEDEVEGIARGIDDRGHLRVELEDGSILAVQAGEVRFI